MRVEYDQTTRQAYRTPEKAARYRAQHTDAVSWARFTMWRETRVVGRALDEFRLGPRDRLLDVPCGTGLAGEVLSGSGAEIVALDISREMMELAREEYDPQRLRGFVQADLTQMPFPDRSFAGTVVLGFMHRVPTEIKEAALRELVRVTERFLIVSFTIDGPVQRGKRSLLRRLRPSYGSAPAPARLPEILELIRGAGLRVRRKEYVAPLFSGEVMFLMEPDAHMP